MTSLHDRMDSENEIDLLELCKIVWNGKWLICAITTIFAIAGVLYALWLPNIYRAEALLSPVESENSSNGSLISGQLGGLASLAGVNLGGSQTNDTVKAIATIQSRAFIKQFFEKHDLLVPFMSVRPVKRSRRVEVDPNLYDVESQSWVREVSPPRKPTPSAWEVYEEFRAVFSVVQDDDTGLIKISIEWYDPEQIKQWVDWLIEDLNIHMKEKDAIETQKAIAYLQEQLEKTSLVEMKSVFYNLIESQTQVAMLADIRDEYSFEQIDPAVVAEGRVSPSRASICILAVLLGGMFGVLLTLCLYFYKPRASVQ